VIRVVLADDHHLVRTGLRTLLEKAHDIEVVGEAGDGDEAIALVEELAPDILVLDIAMPRLDGVQAVDRVLAMGGGTRIVMLSMYSDEVLVAESLQKGVSGYLLKDSVPEELLLAVRAANRGDIYLSPAVSRSVVTGFLYSQRDDGRNGLAELLTPREREVLQLVAEGHTNPVIAERMQISIKTVEKHRSNLMTKLDAHSAAELIRLAVRHRLVFLEEGLPP
jgi:DNA-binding NarL/FixJ family response regulator